MDNEIEAGYCEQDECYIIEEHCQETIEPQKLCSCCCYLFPEFNYDFSSCPSCCSNNHIIIVDSQGCQDFIHNPDPRC